MSYDHTTGRASVAGRLMLHSHTITVEDRLSAKGVEYAPDEVMVHLARCRILDILSEHPDVIDELEQLVDILLGSDAAHSAGPLWEVAWIVYKWAGETAEVRLQDQVYEARLDLEKAQEELQFSKSLLVSERVKEERLEVISDKGLAGDDAVGVPVAEFPKVEWLQARVGEAEGKVKVAEQRLSDLTIGAAERDALERAEYGRALKWARSAREIDPTIGSDEFMRQLEYLSEGVAE